MPGTAHVWVDGDVATAAFLNALPRGVMGYALGPSSDQSGITAETDITGLSVTFTAIASRIYRTWLMAAVSQQTAGGTITIKITDGVGTQLNRNDLTVATGDAAPLPFGHMETGISGSITRKARIATSAGSMTVRGAANLRAFLIVEDVGV